MAFDLVRAVFGHHADDQPADHGDDDHPRSKSICFGTSEMEGPLVVEGHVGKQSNQVVQDECDQTGDESDGHRRQRYKAEPVTRRRRLQCHGAFACLPISVNFNFSFRHATRQSDRLVNFSGEGIAGSVRSSSRGDAFRRRLKPGSREAAVSTACRARASAGALTRSSAMRCRTSRLSSFSPCGVTCTMT